MHRTRRYFLAMAFSLAFGGCTLPDPSAESPQNRENFEKDIGAPSASLEAFEGESRKAPSHSLAEIADFLCKMSVGNFPNWVMYPAYREYLAWGEEEAIAFMADRLEREYAPFYRARYRAISQFIAAHTRCTLAEDGVTAETDAAQAILFRFHQESPNVPNIPDIDEDDVWTVLAREDCQGGNALNALDEGENRDKGEAFRQRGHEMKASELEDACANKIKKRALSDDDWVKAWRAQLEAFWTGKNVKRHVRIVLEPSVLGDYVLRSNVRKNYMAPYETILILKDIDSYDFNSAKKRIDASCRRGTEACRVAAPFWNAAVASVEAAKRLWRDNVEMRVATMESIQLTGNRMVTRVAFDMENRGNTAFKNIEIQTDEATPRLCTMMKRSEIRDTHEFYLNPFEKNRGFCVIEGTLRPDLGLHFLMADSISPAANGESESHNIR